MTGRRSTVGRATAFGLAVLGCGLATAPASAAPVTVAFTDAGEHRFEVPAGVHTLHVVAIGARGGDGERHPDVLKSALGGNGARVEGEIQVIPGSILQVWVGGRGSLTQGGINGGGFVVGALPGTLKPGGGGGASDVRFLGCQACEPDPPGLRYIVAGGGGGGAASGNSGDASTTPLPGGAGGRAGGEGAGSGTLYGGGGGERGYPFRGGAGGSGQGVTPDGRPGSFGEGGDGSVSSGGGGAGGGGGGGIYGGGGGAAGGVDSGAPTPVPISGGGGGGGGGSLVPTGGTIALTERSTQASVTITVDQPPVGTADDYRVDNDEVLQVPEPGVLGNDSDPDGAPLTARVADPPSNGSLTLEADGSFSYDPNAGFVGEDRFTYLVSDGTRESGPIAVTLTVTEPNQPPVAAPDAFGAIGDTPLTVPAPGVLGNDTDPDGDELGAVLNTAPANGTLDLEDDGSLTYTANEDFVGTDSFTYRASDGTTRSEPATVTIKVVAGCGGRRATIVGTPGNDRLRGGSASDVIVGLGGDDVIEAGSRDDVVCGGSGADRIDGGSGEDRLFGGSGDDRIDGGGGSDRLFGGAGIDRLFGGGGPDHLDGGAGEPDVCDGEGGADTATDGCERTKSIG